MYVVAALLLHVALLGAQDAPVVPLFSCWFPSYGPQGQCLQNLVLSYNNTGNATLTISLGPGQNALSPPSYDGQQPVLFLPGLQLFVATLGNVTDTVTWLLDNTTLNVSLSALTSATQCSALFPTSCPTGLAGFCEDGVYCNGAEFCFSSVFGPTGSCSAPASGINCSAGTQCSENPATCLATAAPSEAPTPAPTAAPTGQPTLAPTPAPTRAPTSAPTQAPTAAPTAPPQCSAQRPDCSARDSFCLGPASCDTQSGLCLYDTSWSACAQSDANQTLLLVECVEELQLCVQSVACETNEQCNDGLYCNGLEYCLNGTCFGQVNTSLAAICGAGAVTCTESAQCVAAQQFAISNGAIVAIVFGLTLLVIAIVVISLWIVQEGRAKAKRRKQKNKRK